MSQNPNPPKSAFNPEHGAYRVKAVGKIEGPRIGGQRTFCVVLGLFDFNDNQAVYTYQNGETRPITILSHPMPEDVTAPKILL